MKCFVVFGQTKCLMSRLSENSYCTIVQIYLHIIQSDCITAYSADELQPTGSPMNCCKKLNKSNDVELFTENT